MCDEVNYNKVYISKSELLKHKKTHVQELADDKVLCMDCKETFKSKEDGDNHDCPAREKEKDQNDPNAKSETLGNGNTSNGKRSTRSKHVNISIIVL